MKQILSLLFLSLMMISATAFAGFADLGRPELPSRDRLPVRIGNEPVIGALPKKPLFPSNGLGGVTVVGGVMYTDDCMKFVNEHVASTYEHDDQLKFQLAEAVVNIVTIEQLLKRRSEWRPLTPSESSVKEIIAEGTAQMKTDTRDYLTAKCDRRQNLAIIQIIRSAHVMYFKEAIAVLKETTNLL